MTEQASLAYRTKQIINRYDFAFKKNFGQNFLVDERVLDKIVAASEIESDDVVLEIGPGIGTLTQALAKKAKKVIAVEIDKTLIPILEELLADFSNIEIINEDILKVDIEKLARENNVEKFKVTANLPYYITTPIIMSILEKDLPVDTMTVMIQKEVAMRMQAKANTKDYGALSLAVQYYCEPYLVANVPENCFMPRPNVDSAVIRLKKLSEPAVNVEDRELMFRIIKAAFGQRRKTLVNCLYNCGDMGLDKKVLENVIKETGFDEKVRGEALSLSDYSKLTHIMKKYL